MIGVKVNGHIVQNEVAYVIIGSKKLKSEVIKIENDIAYLQVFEYTKGIKIRDEVEFSGKMLSVQLGPGLLAQVYDGLQTLFLKSRKNSDFSFPLV